ncbi:MAG: metalloprotease TldD, partial [Gammaproteobacteria bacterium]|nr:metalloprotease TldD [Gammaproteobacteria bacterium]
MTSILTTVDRVVLQPAELTLDQINQTLDRLQQHKIDAGDIYFQVSQQESWLMDDGIIREGSFNIDNGVGIRAISGEKTGFAYSDDLQFSALTAAAKNASAIARLGQDKIAPTRLKGNSSPSLYQSENPIDQHTAAQKVDLLKRLDSFTRALDPRIEQVIISLAGSIEHILIAATDNT